MRLSENFTLKEFTASQTAAREGIKNIPDAEAIENMKALCNNVLQPLRNIIQRPVIISSGFRSAELNAAIKGARFSQHVKGEAADIDFDDINFMKIVFNLIIEHSLPFDQLIWEFDSWIHVSHSRSHNRKNIMKASKKRNEAGKLVTVYEYIKGID